jgi:hypothetical protein
MTTERPPDPQRVTISLRLAPGMHAKAKAASTARGVSLTDFINQAIAAAVERDIQPSPTRADRISHFEFDLRFDLEGDGADDHAYQITDQVTTIAKLAGAANLKHRLVRLATMHPRAES